MWLDAIGAVFGGGLTGLIGTGVSKYFDLQSEKLKIEGEVKKYAHEVDMKEADARIMQLEFAARTQVATIEADAKVDVADADLMRAAVSAEAQHYSTGIVATTGQAWMMFSLDLIRGMVRPGLTIYLCAITTAVYVHSRMLLADGAVSAPDALLLVNRIVDTVLYLTVTCVCFWFGTRPKGGK